MEAGGHHHQQHHHPLEPVRGFVDLCGWLGLLPFTATPAKRGGGGCPPGAKFMLLNAALPQAAWRPDLVRCKNKALLKMRKKCAKRGRSCTADLLLS